jgi:hypothetical protein
MLQTLVKLHSRQLLRRLGVLLCSGRLLPPRGWATVRLQPSWVQHRCSRPICSRQASRRRCSSRPATRSPQTMGSRNILWSTYNSQKKQPRKTSILLLWISLQHGKSKHNTATADSDSLEKATKLKARKILDHSKEKGMIPDLPFLSLPDNMLLLVLLIE